MSSAMGVSAVDTESLLAELGFSSMLSQRQYRGTSAEELRISGEEDRVTERETEWPDMSMGMLDAGDWYDYPYGLLPRLPTDTTYAAAAAHDGTRISADAAHSALFRERAELERQPSMGDFDFDD